MMIEKSGTIRLRDIPTAAGLSPKDQELAAGMVRVTHLYRSALKVAVTQMEILDEEFARLYDHSPIHHIEYRIKTLDSIIDKLRRRGLEVSIDNIYAHIQDVAGIRVICNYLDDIYYLRSLLTRSESYTVLREVDYIKEPKDTGYQNGLMGMVTGSDGKSFNLDKVKSSVKEKACDFVLNNAKSLI